MATSRPAFGFLALSVLMGCPGGVLGQNPEVHVEEGWSNLFAGKETVLHLQVRAPLPRQARLAWGVSIGRAALARGEAAVDGNDVKSGRVAVRIPPVDTRPGLVTEAKLTALLTIDGKEAATAERTLWIFPPDPFAGRAKWLKELQIRVFDPQGKTAELLRKLEVPFEDVTNPEAISAIKNGLLLVGEGTSFREERGLVEILLKAAHGGVPVLCLAPADGTFVFPGAADPMPAALSMSGARKIAELDKRLDSQSWRGNHPLVVGGIKWRSEGSDIVGDVEPGERGWSWMDVRFAETRLVICGFGIVRSWDASPTPRYLLLRMLEFVSEKN